MGGRFQISARAGIAVLVASLLAPVIASAVAANLYFLHTFNERIQADALSVARQASADIDSDVEGLINVLRALAGSLALANTDLRAFHDQATDLADVLGVAIIVKDEDGQQLVNTRMPWGAPLPVSMPPADRDLLRTGGSAVSGVFEGATSSGPVIRVATTVALAGGRRGLIAVAADPVRFVPQLVSHSLSDSWTLALVDSEDRVVARSREHARFVGAEATRDLRERTRAAPEGVWLGKTLEGTEVLSAWLLSPVTGWRIAVGIPVAVVSDPMERSMGWLVTVAVLGFGGALLVAAVLGRRVAASMSQTALAAQSLVSAGGLRRPSPTVVKEVARTNAAIVAAADELERRAAERDRFEQDLLTAKERLERVLDTSPVGIVELNAAGEIVYANAAGERLLALGRSINGRRYDAPEWRITSLAGEPVPPEDLPAARALRGEEVTDYEHRIVLPDGTGRVLSINAAPLRRSGGTVGLIATVTDVSARYAAERRRQLLVDELNHRVKNTLAVVLGIAMHTFRSKDTPPDEQRHSFEGRLMALAATHDLLTRANWESADLGLVVRGAVEAYGAERFEIAGPAVPLEPRTVISMAMALHELASNATKYGALRSPSGRIAIRWQVEAGSFRLTWVESGGPPVAPPTRRGFGTKMLERALASEFQGSVRLDFAPDGLRCEVVAPQWS